MLILSTEIPKISRARYWFPEMQVDGQLADDTTTKSERVYFLLITELDRKSVTTRLDRLGARYANAKVY